MSDLGKTNSVTTCLGLRDVSFIFPGNRVHALQNLTLEFHPGELCFLLGENGAGKSTLARLASGFLRPRSGYLMVNGRPYVPRSPKVALRKGVALVPQHPDVVTRLKVWENLALAGHVPGVHGPFRLLRSRFLIQRYDQLLKNFGLEIYLEARAANLSAPEIHWLALAEALVRRPRYLFLDEPSAPYSHDEVERLYSLLGKICETGISVIVISHRLEEIRRFGDRVVVLKGGRLTLDALVKNISDEVITQAMFTEAASENNQREEIKAEIKDYLISPLPKPKEYPLGLEVLNCSALEINSSSGPLLKALSFAINSGEIVGIYSPTGKSSEALEDVLSVLRPCPRGILTLFGQSWPSSPLKLRQANVRYIPSRRFKRGIAEGITIADNIIGHRRMQIYRLGFWNHPAFMNFVRYLPFLVPRRWKAPITTLSGGTIQRVILNRELGEPTAPLILCFEPSWGVDRRLQMQMHAHLRLLAQRGSAILFVSSDQDEVKDIAHRYFELKNGYLREHS